MVATDYSLKEVIGRKEIRAFLELPRYINKGDKNWIRPLDEDIEKVFNPKYNKLFRKGNAIRWNLYDKSGKVIGRIAAFYNMSSAKKNEILAGGCGFFECINEQQAANMLFDAARDWLREQGMEAMDGPVNFGPRDHFWGCLSEGFYEPIFKMPYNPPYYNDLFTRYGFQNYFNQYTYHIPLLAGKMDEVIYRNGEHLKKDPDYRFECINTKHVDKYANDFVAIFNAAWARFPGVKPMRLEQAKQMFHSLKLVVDRRAIIFGYHRNEPISFFIMIPDLYEITKKFNGKFGWIQKAQLYYYLKIRKINKRLVGLIFGVIPRFQGKGTAAGMILRFEKEVEKPSFHYTDLEMNWIGDFNPHMMKLVSQIGGKIRKTHITYRYLFDRNKPFERARKLG